MLHGANISLIALSWTNKVLELILTKSSVLHVYNRATNLTPQCFSVYSVATSVGYMHMK